MCVLGDVLSKGNGMFLVMDSEVEKSSLQRGVMNNFQQFVVWWRTRFKPLFTARIVIKDPMLTRDRASQAYGRLARMP